MSGVTMPEKERLEDRVDDEINITERSEMEGVADLMFNPKKLNSSINIDTFERSNILVCDVAEKVFEFEGFSLTADFKELSQSIGGWKTEKFVNVNQAKKEQQDSGMFKRLFSPPPTQ